MSAESSRTVVIVNPTAGRGRTGRDVERARRCLGAGAAGWSWLTTSGPGDAESMARQVAAEGATTVVAAGGDGTVNEVANGIFGSGCTLGVLPFGTGNDFSRALGLGNDLQTICGALLDGVVRTVDVGSIEGVRTGGKRVFLGVAGAGFDARTAQRVNQGIRFVSGAPAYVLGAILTLARFEPFELTLTLDGSNVRRTRAMFVSTANAATTGGGMIIAPGAEIDDGRFDVCLAEAVSRTTLLYQLTRVFKGEHVRHPAVSMLRCTTVSVDADPPQPLLIDGEVLGTTPATIELQPGALDVIVPRGGADRKK